MEDYNFTIVGFDDNPYNLDIQMEQLDESKSVSTGLSSRNLCGASASFDYDVLSPCFSPASNTKFKFEKSKIFKVMIVGSTGTGRHSLINSAFRENIGSEKKIRNPFNLVIKHQKQDGCLNTFKFWLRDPSDKKMESLIKIYKKSINLYVFVYKVEDYRNTDIETLLQTHKGLIYELLVTDREEVYVTSAVTLLLRILSKAYVKISKEQTINKKWVRIYRFKENALRRDEENIISRTGECFPWNPLEGRGLRHFYILVVYRMQRSALYAFFIK